MNELQTVAQAAWTLFLGAMVVEAIVNIVENIQERNTSWKYWLALAVSLILGLVVGVNYDIDLFKVAGLEGLVPYVGAVLTGLIMSRGANIISDFLGRLNLYRLRSE